MVKMQAYFVAVLQAASDRMGRIATVLLLFLKRLHHSSFATRQSGESTEHSGVRRDLGPQRGQ